MDKNYLNMFSLYSLLSDDIIKEEPSEEVLKIIEKNLRIYINTDSDGSGDDGNISSLAIDESKLTNKVIEIMVRTVKTVKDPKKKEKLIKLINLLKKHLKEANEELVSKILESQPAKEDVDDIVDSIEDDKISDDDLAKKYEDYSLFGLNKALNPNFFPTTQPIVDTKDYDNLSREYIVSMFESNKFNALNQTQQLQLLQATVNEFLSSLGAPTCAVCIEDLPFSKQSTIFGQYTPSKGVISINKNLLEAAKTNEYWPYKILETVIHEARHRWQFSMLDKNATSAKDKAIMSALTSPRGRTYSQYLTALEELDSRNAALEYLREVSTNLNNDSLKAFYNTQLKVESKKPKLPVSKEVESYFPDIYSGRRLETSSTMKKPAITKNNTSNQDDEKQP